VNKANNRSTKLGTLICSAHTRTVWPTGADCPDRGPFGLRAGPSAGSFQYQTPIVGGKISKDITSNNGMDRCVVMVGLPYPSPSDVELLETIKHIESISSSFFYWR
jgi:hypothetical protein